MESSFWWGKKVDNYLFKGFAVNSSPGLLGICLIVFSMSFFFEYLRYLQIRHKQRELTLRVKQLKLLCPTESAALVVPTIIDTRNPLNISLLDRGLLFGAEVSLWLFLQLLGYFLMLSVMIYNVWFLIAAVLGGGIGYFVFGNLFMKLNLQNCQMMRSAFCTQICGETDVQEGESTPAAQGSPSTSQNTPDCHRTQKQPDVTVSLVQCH